MRSLIKFVTLLPEILAFVKYLIRARSSRAGSPNLLSSICIQVMKTFLASFRSQKWINFVSGTVLEVPYTFIQGIRVYYIIFLFEIGQIYNKLVYLE